MQQDDGVDHSMARAGPAGHQALPLVPYKREGSGFGEPLLMNAGRTPKKCRGHPMDLSPVAQRLSSVHQGVSAGWPTPDQRGSAVSVVPPHGNPYGFHHVMPQQPQQRGEWPPSNATPSGHSFGSYQQQLPDPHTAGRRSSGGTGSAQHWHGHPQHTHMEQPPWEADVMMQGQPAAQGGSADHHARAGLLQPTPLVSPPSFMPRMQDMQSSQPHQNGIARCPPEADLHQSRQATSSSSQREADFMRLLSLPADRRIELARALLEGVSGRQVHG